MLGLTPGKPLAPNETRAFVLFSRFTVILGVLACKIDLVEIEEINLMDLKQPRSFTGKPCFADVYFHTQAILQQKLVLF